MNDFVNPQRRSVNLPAGYKDLMEVIEAKESVKGSKVRRPIIERFPTGGLSRVEEFLDRFLNSQSEIAVLLLLLVDNSIAFALVRSPGVIKAVFTFAKPDTDSEEVVKEVFAEAGINTIPNVPTADVGQMMKTYPLPAELTEVLNLVSVVLRRAYEVSGKDVWDLFTTRTNTSLNAGQTHLNFH